MKIRFSDFGRCLICLKNPCECKKEKTDNSDIQCPVCGYYCNGKGGIGCIDKPSLVNPKPETDTL